MPQAPRLSPNGLLVKLLLLLSLLSLGCTDGDKFFISPVANLPGNFNGTDVRDNNRAADGLAFSENGISIDEVRVEVVTKTSELVGPESPTEPSFMTVLRSGARVFASHGNGEGLTQSVELTPPDQDRNQAVSLASAILVPLRLNNYQGINGALGDVNANNQAWVLIYAYNTFTQLGGAGGLGPRRALSAHVFLPSRRKQPLSQDSRLGALEFGWQRQGQQITLLQQEAGEDVVSFAALSDGLIGTAEFTSAASAHSPTMTIPVNGAPGANSYQFGQDMTRLGLLITQIKNDDPSTTENDARLVTQYASFDLAQLNFESSVEFAVPNRHFQPDNVGVFQGATAYDPGLIRVSNQHAFLILKDATRTPNTTNIVTSDQVLTVLTAVDQRDGSSALIANLDTDLSLNGINRGFHGQGIGETAQFLNQAGILGPDEGLTNQTVIFFRVNDNNPVGDPDTDFQLHAAAVDSTKGSGLEGTLSNLPQRLSTHGDTPGVPFSDPVLDPQIALSRDASYAILCYRQNEMASNGPGIAANALVFKTSTASGFPGSRFSPEIRVDNGNLDPDRVLMGQVAPVTDLSIQSLLFPGVGQQSDTVFASLFYEQSFTNQDRVFARPIQINITGPTTASLVSEIELESNNLVLSNRDPNTGRVAFSFPEDSVNLRDFQLIDIGTGPAQSRELLAVFVKEADDTNTDDGVGDRDVIAQQITLDLTTANAGLGFRARIDNTDEVQGAGLPARTELVAVRVPNSRSLSATNSIPNTVTILFKQPSAGNITGPLGLFARVLDLGQFRASANQIFRPNLSEDPLRLDSRPGPFQMLSLGGPDRLTAFPFRKQGNPGILVDGDRTLLFFLQDGHIRASESIGVFSFSNSQGLPAPELVDNEGFGSDVQSTSDVVIAPFDRGQGSTATGAVILYLKQDSMGGNKRALVRIVTPVPRPF
ncbi:MAG: hypothetical protein P1V97_02160 [Planctomycetota bacterium]|nr:hypothetical protein [Planctomycetota bacterium]